MSTVNYGTPTHWVTQRNAVGEVIFTHCVHDGYDGHDKLQPGEQCACGVLGLGIIRESTGDNNLEAMFESFKASER